MALTRPTLNQINTTITALDDPITVVNKSATSANQDIGFVFNRDGGSTANVALIWDETNDKFALVNTSDSGSTNANVTISSYANVQVDQMQADLVRNREQRYTTSNMMKFNQLYTGGAIGSYFEQNEYQKIVTIIPSADSQNYQVSGRILCQTASSIQTINFIAGLRSNTLPDLDWSIVYTDDNNGTAHFKPQLWTKETTTAGFIFAIQKISSGSLYGTVTVDLDVIPRASSQLDNVTVNTTQNSEQTSIDAGYTANDMTLVQRFSGTDATFGGNVSTDGYFIGDGSQLTGISGSGLSDIVEDTTPQLGGNLDLNSSNITGTGDVNITGTGTFTGNVTAGNLVTSGTVTLDRLALTSSQTTVSPLQLTASSLNDGVGALRIDGAQADIFLNPDTATHTTVTFAVNDDQRLAFGMDNNSDFYITRRTGGVWYDNTLVIDRASGQVSLGYDLTVAGNLTINGTTTTVDTTNTTMADSLVLLSSGQTGTPTKDSGVIIERGSSINAGFIWDESADEFVAITTSDDATTSGDVTISAYANVRVGSTFVDDVLRIAQNASGLRMTNVGAFDNDGSDNFRIFATNDLILAANGESGTAITIDATNSNVAVSNDLTVAGQATVTGNVTAGYFIGDGSQLTGIAGSYGDSDVDAHLSGGTGVTYSSGTISIGQAVGTGDSVTFTGITIPSITKNGTDGVGDIGQTGNRFGTIYGVASSATYADLAEKYISDKEYAPGTVVVFGGPYEITESTQTHQRSVAGVISTAPAYLMNDDEDGLAVALQGRVPCQVLGPIRKGDLVVASEHPGIAQRLNDAMYRPGCVIGKALNDIETAEIVNIEVVVGRL